MKSRLRENHIRHNQKLPVVTFKYDHRQQLNLFKCCLVGTKRSERESGRRDYERPRPYNNDPPDLYNSPKRRQEERYRPYQELYQPPTTDDPAWPQPSNLKPHRTPKQRRESERYKAPSKPPTSDNPSSKPPSASDHSSKEKGPPPEKPDEQAQFLRFMEKMKADLSTQLSQQINAAFLNISKQIHPPVNPMVQETGMVYQYPSQNFPMTNPYQVSY